MELRTNLFEDWRAEAIAEITSSICHERVVRPLTHITCHYGGQRCECICYDAFMFSLERWLEVVVYGVRGRNFNSVQNPILASLNHFFLHKLFPSNLSDPKKRKKTLNLLFSRDHPSSILETHFYTQVINFANNLSTFITITMRGWEKKRINLLNRKQPKLRLEKLTASCKEKYSESWSDFAPAKDTTILFFFLFFFWN